MLRFFTAIILLPCFYTMAMAFFSQKIVTNNSIKKRLASPACLLKMSLSSTSSSSSSSSKVAECVSQAARSLNLFRETPLVLSRPLSSLVGRDVYLKLDALQNSGSFKDRGMAHLCHTLQTTQGTTNLISSSGGNAGLAVATVGSRLGMSVSVVVPQTTKPLVIEKLRALGASVTVHGENWNAADDLARERAASDPDASAYISPYDNPLLWTGHSTVVDEIQQQLFEQNNSNSNGIGAIIVCVGGGGLLCGVFEGLQRQANNNGNSIGNTAVIAAETTGAASFGKAWEKGNLVRLDSIDSIATSLGALEVTPVALDRARQHEESSGGGMVTAATCTDAEAVDACVRFAEDHRLLVEPACGAALAVAYSERLRSNVLAKVKGEGPIVIQVCGGSGVNLELLSQWKAQFLE